MKKKGTTKKTKKPGKTKAKKATLSVTLDGVETGPVTKRENPKSIAKECEKLLKDARKANPLLDAFLGFLKHVGFDTSGIRAVYMIPEPARKTPRQTTGGKGGKRGKK